MDNQTSIESSAGPQMGMSRAAAGVGRGEGTVRPGLTHSGEPGTWHNAAMNSLGQTDITTSVYVSHPAGANGAFPLVYRAPVDSTNTACLNALREPDTDAWCSLWTDCQTAGRGRQGRRWSSQPGDSLCLSVGRRLPAGVYTAPGLPVAIGVALVEAVRQLGCPVSLKWPNDLLLDNRKLGGVLCEAVSAGIAGETALVAGVGINLRRVALPATPDSTGQPAVALQPAALSDAGLQIAPGDWAHPLATAIATVLAVAHDSSALAQWCTRANASDAWLGRSVSVVERGVVVCTGEALGVAADGQYQIRHPYGVHRVSVGDLSLRESL